MTMGHPYNTSSLLDRNGRVRYIGLWIGIFVLINGLHVGCATTDRWSDRENMESPFLTQAYEGNTLRTNALGQVGSLSHSQNGLRQIPSTPQWVTRLLEDPSAP